MIVGLRLSVGELVGFLVALPIPFFLDDFAMVGVAVGAADGLEVGTLVGAKDGSGVGGVGACCFFDST